MSKREGIPSFGGELREKTLAVLDNGSGSRM